MSASDPILSDRELRDLLKARLMAGATDDSFTQQLIDMEATIAFSTTTPLIPMPVGMEQELIRQLGAKAGAKLAGKAAAKLGLKWLFTGLGCVSVATGVVVYKQATAESEQPQKAATTIAVPAQSLAAVQPDSIAQNTPAPTTDTPEHSTEHHYLLSLPVPPIFPEPVGFVAAALPGEEERAAPGPVEAKAPRTAFAPPAWEFPENPISQGMMIDTLFTGVQTLEIVACAGDITVNGSQRQEVHFAGDLGTFDEKDKGPDCKVTYHRNGDVLVINIDPVMRKRKYRFKPELASNQLNVAVPAGMNLRFRTNMGYVQLNGVQAANTEVTTDFNTITVNNHSGKLTANSNNGDLTLRGITGDVNASSNFGSISITDLKGQLTATANSSSFMGQDLIGPVTVRTEFGDVELHHVEGELRLTSNAGTVSVDGLTCQKTTIKSDFGNVVLRNLTTTLDLTTNSGNTDIIQLNGNASINASFGGVDLSGMTGNLNVYSNSGNLTIKDLTGDLDVDSKFGNVAVNGSKGNVTFNSNSGNLRARNMTLTDSLSVNAQFGNSEIQLTNAVDDLSFDLNTEFGKSRVSMGQVKMEKENGTIQLQKGRIKVSGSANSGNLVFN